MGYVYIYIYIHIHIVYGCNEPENKVITHCSCPRLRGPIGWRLRFASGRLDDLVLLAR